MIELGCSIFSCSRPVDSVCVCDVNESKRLLEASQRLCLHMKKDSFYSQKTGWEAVKLGAQSTFGFFCTQVCPVVCMRVFGFVFF